MKRFRIDLLSRRSTFVGFPQSSTRRRSVLAEDASDDSTVGDFFPQEGAKAVLNGKPTLDVAVEEEELGADAKLWSLRTRASLSQQEEVSDSQPRKVPVHSDETLGSRLEVAVSLNLEKPTESLIKERLEQLKFQLNKDIAADLSYSTSLAQVSGRFSIGGVTDFSELLLLCSWFATCHLFADGYHRGKSRNFQVSRMPRLQKVSYPLDVDISTTVVTVDDTFAVLGFKATEAGSSAVLLMGCELVEVLEGETVELERPPSIGDETMEV
jgi:hypothetical protein